MSKYDRLLKGSPKRFTSVDLYAITSVIAHQKKMMHPSEALLLLLL